MRRDATTAGAAGEQRLDELELVLFSPGAPRTIPLSGRWERVVGRGQDAEVRIDHPTVSRRHARIYGGTAPMLEDLGSHNGTTLGGGRLEPGKRVPLAPYAVVGFGSVFAAVRPSSRSSHAAPPTKADLEQAIALVAPTDLPILIVGETGVGKEVLAEQLQAHSRRKNAPFIRINCAALAESLAESELFGHERGAFTGATHKKSGLLEAAHGGTVFLDEIGELSMPIQAKLLRAVESGELTRVGSTTPRSVDVRYIAATHRDLKARIQAGSFREDLYFRLDGMTLVLRPLRERRDDIEELAQKFLEKACEGLGQPLPALTSDARNALFAYEWPGNIRELKRVMERAALLSRGKEITMQHLVGISPSLSEANPPSNLLEEARAESSRLERARITEALAKTGGNQTKAAALLGIARRTLVNRIREFGIRRVR